VLNFSLATNWKQTKTRIELSVFTMDRFYQRNATRIWAGVCIIQ